MLLRSRSRSPLQPTMPIDMAFPLYLSKEEFVYRTPSKTCEPALNSCLRFQRSRCVDQTGPEDGRACSRNAGRAKKQVTFADHQGLSLTMVKTFSEFSDPIGIPLNIQELLRPALCAAAEEDKLLLDCT